MKLLIDKTEIPALPGDTIMDAARRAGIFISGLCWNEASEKSHCCRLCMVEVMDRGKKKLVAACAFKVKDLMEVTTDSPRIARIRKTMLRLLYTQAPDNPAIVELMDRYDIAPEPTLPVRDNTQCILCRLCVSNCSALGASAISAVDRGITKRIDTPYGAPSPDCIGCGACADICPTNCIEVEDTPQYRKIWNQEFAWARCSCCGAVITTEAHYQASNPPEAPVLCPSCKKKALGDVFAESLGERI